MHEAELQNRDGQTCFDSYSVLEKKPKDFARVLLEISGGREISDAKLYSASPKPGWECLLSFSPIELCLVIALSCLCHLTRGLCLLNGSGEEYGRAIRL